ncbi:hypothetical protein MPSEU_001103300 [Mayamaea pseudoterrestris]|nr:hypothetical protein MPSEU_001103300 [Mayamaea pseudoterrestris]
MMADLFVRLSHHHRGCRNVKQGLLFSRKEYLETPENMADKGKLQKPAASPSPQDSSSSYVPRQSNRVAANQTPLSDGDVWNECLSVCEGATPSGAPKLMVRSYFRNQRTQQKVWDEPPSGASSVKFASSDKRAKAQAKLNELQTTLDMIPPDSDENEQGWKQVQHTLPSSNKKETKGGFFRKLIKKKEKPIYQINESQDINLQRAIAQSMVDFHGHPSTSNVDDEPIVLFDTESSTPLRAGRGKSSRPAAEDDDLELAKALSMSHGGVNNLSEEEQLLMALEQSRIEAEQGMEPTSVAAAARSTELEDLVDYSEFEAVGPAIAPSFSDDDLDRKMPAVERVNPFESPPPSPSKIATFDPYYSPTSLGSQQEATFKSPPPPSAADIESLSLPPTEADLLSMETLQQQEPAKHEKEQQTNKPKRNVGRMFAGGRRKAIEDEAGVV